MALILPAFTRTIGMGKVDFATIFGLIRFEVSKFRTVINGDAFEYFTEFRAIGFIQVLHGLAHSFGGPSIYAQGYVFMSKFLYKCKDNSLMALLLAHDSITFPMAYEPRYVWPIIDASASRTLSGRNMVFILTSLENQWQVEHTYWQKALANPVIQRFHTGYTSIWKNMLTHYTANTTIQ